MLQCAGVFGVKLRIIMCPIIRDGVMFDDGQRQLDPQDGPPPSLPTISPLRIVLRTRRTSPLSQSDLVQLARSVSAASSLLRLLPKVLRPAKRVLKLQPLTP